MNYWQPYNSIKCWEVDWNDTQPPSPGVILAFCKIHLAIIKVFTTFVINKKNNLKPN